MKVKLQKRKKNKTIPSGTLRIKTKDFKVYEKTNKGWKKSSSQFKDALRVIKLFKAHHNLKCLIDSKNPLFLKGQVSPEGRILGEKINILPDGQVLNGLYSLFSNHLTIHDQDTHDHWDVLYQNDSGSFSYVYTVEKSKQHQRKKYCVVTKFDNCYKNLRRNVLKALNNKDDQLALPLYTLLKTYMRVGNEIYYKASGHKGLTTLRKEDILIDGNKVTFDYVGKSGVPIKISYPFSKKYISRLESSLKMKKQKDLIFVKDNHPLSGCDFKKAFYNYCGEEFYPHIVRSHYATMAVKNFLNKNKKAKKEQINKFFLSIAAKLGHKRFNKKKNRWEDNFTVTINSYVKPELIEKIKKLPSD